MGEKKKSARQALYRKYRSKSLSEIVGQEHITKTLENAIANGKISHAYLFTGPRGTGKTSIARILAHAINELPYEDETTHLDIIEIDAASNRRIDDIRDLRDKVNIAPTSAKYKVYIIDEVHMLTNESFNALLKTLEEPPAHVIFILATTEVHKLPATIISRTQRHSFRLVPSEKVIEHLAYIAKQEGIKIDKSALSILAKHGGGSFRDSISLLDQMSSSSEPINSELVELLLGLAPEETLQSLLSTSLNGESAQVLTYLETLLETGLTPSGVASQLQSLLRNEVKNGSNTGENIKLMNDLLLVHNAQYPQLKLETILLSVAAPQIIEKTPVVQVAPKPTLVTAKKTTQPQEPAVETTKAEAPEEVKAKPEQNTPEKKTTKRTVPLSAGTLVIEEHWPKVLAIVKEKNNPLYTVLRLATPELEGDGLVLIFSFPFHQKKIEEAKYKAVIAEILQDVVGGNVDFRSIVDKTRSKPANSTSLPTNDPAHASLITSVQDIMGGGEVVNV